MLALCLLGLITTHRSFVSLLTGHIEQRVECEICPQDRHTLDPWLRIPPWTEAGGSPAYLGAALLVRPSTAAAGSPVQKGRPQRERGDPQGSCPGDTGIPREHSPGQVHPRWNTPWLSRAPEACEASPAPVLPLASGGQGLPRGCAAARPPLPSGPILLATAGPGHGLPPAVAPPLGSAVAPTVAGTWGSRRPLWLLRSCVSV